MSADVKYTPLAPVYKAASAGHDEEIALEELAVPPRDCCAKAGTAACCCAAPATKDACCAKDAKQLPLGRRIARCFCATLLVGLCLWMITGAAMVTYLGAKAHRCLHPRHVASREFTWTPASLPALELGVVTGSLHIRSCPKAKNVTLTVHTYAGTEALLDTMVISREALAAGARGERVVLRAPSFDWAHCQRAVLELVVPEGAGLDVKAQAIVGRMDVRASKSAVRNLVLASSAAHIDLHHVQLSGALRVDAEMGCVRARDVHAQDVHTDLRLGFLEMREVSAAATVHTTVRIGKASLTHVSAASELVHQSEIAHVNMWDAAAPALTARVDYGALHVAVEPNFAGHFVARSPYGFLSAQAAAAAAARYSVAQETLALIEGDVAAAQGAHAAPQSVTLDAVYGSVDLFVPAPETAWERRHHRRP